MKRYLLLPILGTAVGISASAFAASPTPDPSPSSTPPSLTRQTSVLGKAFGITYSAGENSDKNGITASFSAKILGKQRSLVKANLSSNAEETEGSLQVFVAGIQVSSVQGAISKDLWSHQFTIPPVNVSGTIVSVPIGPVVLKVNGGYALGGGLGTDLGLGSVSDTDPTPASVKAAIDATIQASGFVDGSVNFAVVRGGLKGQVDAADGEVKTSAELSVIAPPTFAVTGQLSLFSGKVSAYADYFSFFAGWREFWSGTLFKWDGLCFNFNNDIETHGKCVAQPQPLPAS